MYCSCIRQDNVACRDVSARCRASRSTSRCTVPQARPNRFRIYISLLPASRDESLGFLQCHSVRATVSFMDGRVFLSETGAANPPSLVLTSESFDPTPQIDCSGRSRRVAPKNSNPRDVHYSNEGFFLCRLDDQLACHASRSSSITHPSENHFLGE